MKTVKAEPWWRPSLWKLGYELGVEPGTGPPDSRQLCQRLPDTQGRKRTSWLPRAAQAILHAVLNDFVPSGTPASPRAAPSGSRSQCLPDLWNRWVGWSLW